MDNAKLSETARAFPMTDIWMDSFVLEEQRYGMAHGCVGITTSPTHMDNLLHQEYDAQKGRIAQIAAEHPQASVEEVLWLWTYEVARARAKAWLPYFEKSGGHQGRFSIQVNVHNYRSGPAMLAQALEIHAIAPNMQVKIPSTQAGIWAMEEASAAGVSVMATLCYSVSQAEAAAEAVERGLARRAAQGLPTEDMNPVCAVLLDMQDQFQQGYCQKHDIVVDPDCFCYGGVAVAKKVYALYQQKQYRTRMLVAYYGSHLHWSEFIGGDLIMTIPYRWQLRFNASDVPVAAGIDRPVAPRIVEQLCTRVPPYRLAYEQGAMQPADFDSFGPVVRTLLRFGSQYEDALCLVRGIMLPDPLA